MGLISPILRNCADGGYTFWCPGCDEPHHVTSGWTYNGNPNAPTFTPSIHVSNGHYIPGFQPGDSCWCTFNAKLIAEGKEPSVFTCGLCHTFVTDGKIQFLNDCTHHLAGQTVPIPPWPNGD